MTGGRWARALPLVALILLIVAAASIAVFSKGRHPPLPARSAAEKPVLMLLTSLPLVFPETFSLKGGGSPALAALEKRYRIVSIPVADKASLRNGGILLMAHALAQPSEALVDLDSWVRRGGRLVLLADPMLEWDSERPLGDPLRPAPMFPDTGLLAHWGLKLEAPDRRGPVQRKIGPLSVLTFSPGALSGGCEIAGDRLVARCRIGKGQVIVIADADFLDVGGPEDHADSAAANLEALLQQLAAIEPR